MKNPFAGIFSKAAPDRRPADAPRAPDLLWVSTDIAAAIVQYRDYVNAERAMCHPIIYRALDKISKSVSTVRWFAEVDPLAAPRDRRGKGAFISDMDALLNNPNDDMSAQQLRYWMALNYAVYGRVPFKVSFSAVQATRANGIFPLEAQYVNAKFNQRGSIEKYEYGHGDEKDTLPSKDRASPGKSYAAEIWKPGLKGRPDRKDTSSPLASIGLPAMVITELLKRAIATAQGHPNAKYLVVAEKTLTDPQKKALKEHLQSFDAEGENSGRIPILQNVGKIDIHTLDNNLSDIHSKMPMDDMTRSIFGAFDIPIALAGLGAADAAKFANNYDGSQLAFWQGTIAPGYLMPISDGLTKALCPPGVRISFDLDSIPALMAGRIASMAAAKDVDFLSADEKREMFGFERQGANQNQEPIDDQNAE